MDMDTVNMLLGLLAERDMPSARDRTPTLAEMSRDALTVLSHDPDGFFVMIEGSQPDWFGHDNADLSLVVDEVVDFDRAIGAALAFQARHPETLIVVVADHETGGLALHSGEGGFGAHWTTTGHTAEWVPLFAKGPGAERFGGAHDNYVVGRMIMDLLGVQPDAMAGEEP
jgi:alkaline phosphatase